MPTCKNCNQPFQHTYCEQCGQRDNNGKFTAKELAGDFVSQVMTLELPLLHTTRQLLTQPGQFCMAYIRGRRRPFTPPIQYFLTVLGVYFLIRALINFDPIVNQYKIMGKEPPQGAALTAGHFVAQNLNTLLFAMVFIFAFYVWLFFRKTTYSYAENVVLGFYSVATYMLFSALVMLLTLWQPAVYLGNNFIAIVYLTWVLTDFHPPKRWWGVLKRLLVSLLSYLTYIAFATVVGVFYAWWIKYSK